MHWGCVGIHRRWRNWSREVGWREVGDPDKEVEFFFQAIGIHGGSGAGGDVTGFHFSADPSGCCEEEGWLASEEPGRR